MYNVYEIYGNVRQGTYKSLLYTITSGESVFSNTTEDTLRNMFISRIQNQTTTAVFFKSETHICICNSVSDKISVGGKWQVEMEYYVAGKGGNL